MQGATSTRSPTPCAAACCRLTAPPGSGPRRRRERRLGSRARWREQQPLQHQRPRPTLTIPSATRTNCAHACLVRMRILRATRGSAWIRYVQILERKKKDSLRCRCAISVCEEVMRRSAPRVPSLVPGWRAVQSTEGIRLPAREARQRLTWFAISSSHTTSPSSRTISCPMHILCLLSPLFFGLPFQNAVSPESAEAPEADRRPGSETARPEGAHATASRQDKR